MTEGHGGFFRGGCKFGKGYLQKGAVIENEGSIKCKGVEMGEGYFVYL